MGLPAMYCFVVSIGIRKYCNRMFNFIVVYVNMVTHKIMKCGQSQDEMKSNILRRKRKWQDKYAVQCENHCAIRFCDLNKIRQQPAVKEVCLEKYNDVN